MSDEDEKDKKDTFNSMEEVIEEIKKNDPHFNPDSTKPSNVFSLKNDLDLSHYQILNFGQLEKTPLKPVDYVFYPCLPTQGICFIYAATGLGKTLFALNLAYAIAGGGNFLKYSCPKPRKVLYIDGEMPFNQLHSRLMQIAAHQGELDFEDNFNIITPDKVLPYRVPKIDEVAGQNIYNAIIEKYNFEVIVVDNISMLSSFDENKSNEWIIIQDWFLFLRSMGKTVIPIHHAGKDKNGYRGTSRMLDCADVAISLQPVTDDNQDEALVNVKKFKIVYQKARLFGGKEALPYEVTLENGTWKYRSIEQCELDRIVELFGLKMTQRDIAKEMGLSLSKVNRLVRKAKDLKLIRD